MGHRLVPIHELGWGLGTPLLDDKPSSYLGAIQGELELQGKVSPKQRHYHKKTSLPHLGSPGVRGHQHLSPHQQSGLLSTEVKESLGIHFCEKVPTQVLQDLHLWRSSPLYSNSLGRKNRTMPKLTLLPLLLTVGMNFHCTYQMLFVCH